MGCMVSIGGQRKRVTNNQRTPSGHRAAQSRSIHKAAVQRQLGVAAPGGSWERAVRGHHGQEKPHTGEAQGQGFEGSLLWHFSWARLVTSDQVTVSGCTVSSLKRLLLFGVLKRRLLHAVV